MANAIYEVGQARTVARTALGRGFGGRRASGRSAAAVRPAAVGLGLSRPLRRVLARARQCLLGRHFGRDRVPAAARGFDAQGVVPDGRHHRRRRHDRGAERVLSAGSHRLSDAPGVVVRCLRFRRHADAQLRLLRGGARRLHRGDHRRRHARRHRRPGRTGLHVGGHPRQRDLHRDRMRRHRARRDRLWRLRSASWPSCSPLWRPRSRADLPACWRQRDHDCRTRALSDASLPGASSRSTRRSTGRSGNPANCATTRRCCRWRWRACSRRSMAGAQLQRT